MIKTSDENWRNEYEMTTNQETSEEYYLDRLTWGANQAAVH